MRSFAPARRLNCLIIGLMAATSAVLSTEETKYYVQSLSSLRFVEADAAEAEAHLRNEAPRHWDSRAVPSVYPYIQFEDASIRAFIGKADTPQQPAHFFQPERPMGELQMAVEIPAGEKLSGTLWLPYSGNHRLQPYRFTLEPGEAVSETAFQQIRQYQYAFFAARGVPGTAWFRQQAGSVELQPPARRRDSGLDASFALFTGGRAISENLALDEPLILADHQAGDPVDIATIQGIEVEAIDWAARLDETLVDEVDPLAYHVPEDQHIALFPSPAALVAALNVFIDEGVPVLQTISLRNPFAHLPERYLGQMGLSLSDLDSALFEAVGGIALTGGDPFFPTGTDIVWLLESEDPEVLYATLTEHLAAKAEAAGAEKADTATSAAEGWSTPDRAFSAYLMQGDGFVALANAPQQIAALQAVADGERPSLGGTDEYRYFRQRYLRDAPETAFVFLSDAAIRRWCGPEMRIAASRRARAAAALSHLTAAKIADEAPLSDYAALLGNVTSEGPAGAPGLLRSEHFNTLAFLTPTSALDLSEVTPAEAAAYERWRTRYERTWATVFDPIALRLVLTEDTRAMDLSVIPLRASSDYQGWIDLIGGAELKPADRTSPPGRRVQLNLAIDTDTPAFQGIGLFAQDMLPGLEVNPLAWVGNAISVFADDDIFWEFISEIDDPDAYIEGNLSRAPIGLRIASNSPLRLAAFLTGIRSLAEQSAPGLLRWETLSHGDQPFVAVRYQEAMALPVEGLFYASLPSALIVSLNEDTVRRAIDHEQNRSHAPQAEDETEPGRHLWFEIDLPLVEQLPIFNRYSADGARSVYAWTYLPILNEWKWLDPDLEDPVAFHLAHFGEHIDRSFRWSADYGTMESSDHGHPGLAYLPEASGRLLVEKFERLRVGLDFEDGGLRAQGRLLPATSSPADDDATAVAEAPESPALDWDRLYPLVEGSRYVYEVSEAWETEPFDLEITVGATESADAPENQIVHLSVITRPDGEIEAETFLITPKGIFERTYESADFRRTHGEQPTPFIIKLAFPGDEITLPFEATEYFVDEQTGEEEVSTEIGTSTFRIKGFESVTVPAGTFPNALLVSNRLRYTYDGVREMAYFETWLVEDIGLVKSRLRFPDWESVEVLKEYSIPD